MEHFQPGNHFQQDTRTVLQKAIDWTSYLWKKFSKPEEVDIPADRLIWLCIVDDAMISIAQGLSKEHRDDFKKLSDPLLAGYKKFVQQEDNNFESFRTTAYSIVKLAAHMSLGVSKVSLVSETSLNVLEKQVLFISKTISAEGQEKLGDYFASLVVVLNDYWELNESIVPEVRKKFFDMTFKFNMQSISQEWQEIISTVLTKAEGKLGMLIDFMRLFNEFVEELKDLKFEWFVKANSVSKEMTAAGIVEIVNNKLGDGNNASYLVKDPETFVRVMGEEKKRVPPHYVIRIVQQLLATVNAALRGEVLDETLLDYTTCLNVSTALLSAMRSSNLYLKEQPDYLDFELFYKESTEPFVNVLNGSRSQEDITERISRIKESFWYIRKQDEIGIEKALDLFGKMNDGFSRDILEFCYRDYVDQFTSYIDIHSKERSTEAIIASVQTSAKIANDSRIEEWTSYFKREVIPAILAGLAAVWCVRESKDIASTGKSLKPHCVQILSILRLLSVDSDVKGVEKHFAQVSTGQGKSLVLGLLTCLLALVGYNVRVVCYSDYLSTRDEQAFMKLFEDFGVKNRIEYGTLDDIAFAFQDIVVDGQRKGFVELVNERILGVEGMKQDLQMWNRNVRNTILLIDEVDVFFSDDFYGSTIRPCSVVGMPMLADIQTEIWRIVNRSCHDRETIIKRMMRYTNRLNEKSHTFLSDPRTYELPRETHKGRYILVEYTNRSLYDEHLIIMVDHALEVFNGCCENDWYMINKEGIIAFKSSDGRYETSICEGYRNVFNYFRLKGNDYDHKNYKNYGYFNIDCGEIAYAKVPEEYPLILGVSGTLKGLNKHEQATVSHVYKITKSSIMPSYFGHSSLEFDKTKCFMIQNTEEKWLDLIFSHADYQIRSERSVLIFFDTDVEIDEFRNKFHSSIARLNVLTLNTEPQARERCITEAGVAKTVTLATRTMGRGVDFKSGLTVEKNGGVHVIQTFFSFDVKEEMQIKGRTARKDNKGSYELILCRRHLRKEGYLHRNSNVSVNYEYLNEKRKELVDIEGEKIAMRIRDSENAHADTMRFLRSLCK